MLNDLLAKNSSAGAASALYVEDVFSTYLYTGNDSTQTITNGINLSVNGGLVWTKFRAGSLGGGSHLITDSQRGITKQLITNGAQAEGTPYPDRVSSFNTNGYSLGPDPSGMSNYLNQLYASWTFRKSAKFFDIVTYTGTGANRTISHSLGIAPGMIMVKRTDTTGDWQVYHRSLANTEYLVLNTTASKATGATRWNSTTADASTFSLGTDATVNANSGSYVAYLFAHDDTANGIVQCGSYTGNGSASGPSVTLGWEPQYVLIKMSSSTGDWQIFDNMRGISTGDADPYLFANTTVAEATTNGDLIDLTPTGFTIKSTNSQVNTNTGTYIYIAIRRGPMRTPTSGGSIYNSILYNGNFTANRTLSSFGIKLDAVLFKDRDRGNFDLTDYDHVLASRLTNTGSRTQKASGEQFVSFADFGFQNTIKLTNLEAILNPQNSDNMVASGFSRAPSVFDVVAYSGNGSARTISHNIGVAPELIIVKRRDTTGDWQIYAGAASEYLTLNSAAAKVTSNTDRWNNTAPTTSVFSLGTNAVVNASGGTYVAYLFASCPGVSKVGSYTGNGSSLNIDCGFTSGARFVLIKRTDNTGDWYVWDTARGINTGTDPHLSLNSTSAEVTTDDTIDPLNAGFTVNQLTATNVNVNTATYIYLAIA